MLWLTSALNSLPVHFLWDSAIVQRFPAHDYSFECSLLRIQAVDPNVDHVGEWGEIKRRGDNLEQQWYKAMLPQPVNLRVYLS